MYKPLTKSEVIKTIERKNPTRIPLVMTKWWGEGLNEQYGERLNHFEKYPLDAEIIMFDPFQDLNFNPGKNIEKKAHDASGLLADWEDLDDFIEALPDPDREGLFDPLLSMVERLHKENKYFLFGWWGLFFERPWGLRGMENILVDYFINPEKVHRLHHVLCNQYVALIKRAIKELQPDGFWTSDDLGHQQQLMMKPDQFQEFLKPYYSKVGNVCKEGDIHFWLHSCGNNTAIFNDLIEAGVEVFHPVQKHTMDERDISDKYGDRITFLVGFDVQHILQEGSPEKVREEVRYLIDTFDRTDGGMCLAAGNGIVAGTPFENIEAFLDEAYIYGKSHRKKMNQE